MQTRAGALQVLHHLGPVGVAVVPGDDEVPRDCPQEPAQEPRRAICAYIFSRELEIERQVFACGAYRNRGDDAQAAVRETMDGFVGVKPLGAQVRLTEGMRRKPDSSTKAMWAWSFWAVFLPWANHS